MAERTLLLAPLRKALASLDAALAVTHPNDLTRDGAIQRFEYTYEFCWKLMKRHLEWTGTLDSYRLSKKDIFRQAVRGGLISDPERWFLHHEARNESTHAYDENIATKVFGNIGAFAKDAHELLENLTRYHA
ncbi:MAG: nucleotidyltransferase substrate binding protein [Flavobacteriales bacterium]|nr:nucleotidyltransferase substrate binding protein [Flavobacteriales bacterium]